MKLTKLKKNEEIFKHSLMNHRQKLNSLKPSIKMADEVKIIEKFVKISENVVIPIRILRPENIEPPYISLLFIPGTAFVAQEIDITQALCSQIAKLGQCQVIVINHRLAPENQFPKGLLDAVKVIAKIFYNPQALKLDIDNTVLAGYSSGGNFAAQLGLFLKNKIRCNILISPILDLSRSLKKYVKFEQNDKVISEAFVHWFLRLYIPKNTNPKNPILSPYFQTSDKLKNLAFTHLVYGERDRFRSDAEAYYKKLNSAGNAVKCKMFKNSDHSFFWHQYESFEFIAKLIKLNTRMPFTKTISNSQLFNNSLFNKKQFNIKNSPIKNKKQLLSYSTSL